MKNINFVFYCILIFFAFNNSAFAYIDGGTGAYLLQMILVFFASCILFIKKPILFIKEKIKKLFKKKSK